MGHRASIAYWNGEQVSAHYSHWGAIDVNLLDEITPATPFGSNDLTPDVFNTLVGTLANTLSDQEDVEIAAHREPEVEGNGLKQRVPIEPEPFWEGDSLTDWATDGIDYLLHEAAYLVDMRDDEWEVKAFVPIRWLEYEPTEDPRTHDHGALVEVDGKEEYGEIYGIEYEWKSEDTGVDDSDGLSETEFIRKVHEEFGERVPEFCQYHPTNFQN